MATTTGTKDVNTFLSQRQNVTDKDLAGEWAALEELYNKKYVVLLPSFLLDQINKKII